MVKRRFKHLLVVLLFGIVFGILVRSVSYSFLGASLQEALRTEQHSHLFTWPLHQLNQTSFSSSTWLSNNRPNDEKTESLLRWSKEKSPIWLQKQEIGKVSELTCRNEETNSTNEFELVSCTIFDIQDLDASNSKMKKDAGAVKCPTLFFGGFSVLRHNNTLFLFVGTKDSSGSILRLFQSNSHSVVGSSWKEASLQIPWDVVSQACRNSLSHFEFVHQQQTDHTRHFMFLQCLDDGGNDDKDKTSITLFSDNLYQWRVHGYHNYNRVMTTMHNLSMPLSRHMFWHQNTTYLLPTTQDGGLSLAKGYSEQQQRQGESFAFRTLRNITQGVQHMALYNKPDTDTLFVFLTLMGDVPKRRIVLATMDLPSNNNNRNLRQPQWRLWPGPTLLNVRHDAGFPGMHRHHHHPDDMAHCGDGGLAAAAQMTNPFFLPDVNEHKWELRGTLFYTLPGRQAIGAVRIQIKLPLYQKTVRFRNPNHIDKLVHQSSSLALAQPVAADRRLLITGVGRSGTMFMCAYLNQLGWGISHDNSEDCGPFGGGEHGWGASSWYHAFRQVQDWGNNQFPLRVQQVIHLVRFPLDVVKSRVSRKENRFAGPRLLMKIIGKWEDYSNVLPEYDVITKSKTLMTNNTIFASFMLRNWINRNSFVSQHAEWRVSIDDLSNDPLETWMLCLEVGRDDCLYLTRIHKVLNSMDRKTNTNGRIESANIPDSAWWETLALVSKDDVRIALKMAAEYGFQIDEFLKRHYDINQVKYRCQFANDKAARSGSELPRKWGCFLVDDYPIEIAT